MQVYGSLKRAQLEPKSSDYATTISGLIWWNTAEGRVKVDDGTTIRALLRNDTKLVIGNSGTASQNVRLYRSGTTKIQLTTGDDATAEGSVSTLVGEIGLRLENYNSGSKPANSMSNLGRTIYNTTDDRLEWDNGTTWVGAGSTSSSGSVDALDVIINLDNDAKLRGLREPLPNSVTNSFTTPTSTYQCYLLENYTSTTTNIKLCVNPKFVNNSDKFTDSISGWTAATDGSTFAVGATNKKTGTGAFTFTKATGATTAQISRTAPGESVFENAYLYFWFLSNSGISGTLANVYVRAGVDSSNYTTWTTTVDASNTTISTSQVLLRFDLSNTSGTSNTGTGWTTATPLSYFAAGITTDASGDTPTVYFDSFLLADSSGKYANLGEELTIYDASNRDSFVIDSSNSLFNGSLTIAAAMSNSYSAVAATVVKRNTMDTSSLYFSGFTQGLSGNIAKTQEVRIRRQLPVSISNQNFKAYTSFVTSEAFNVMIVTTNTSIGVYSQTDVSARWLSGRVIVVSQTVGDGNGGSQYIPRTTTYTLTGNATYSGSTLTLPLASNTTGITVGDLVFKKQTDCKISVATTSGNESFQSMTRDRVEILNFGVPYLNPTKIWAQYSLSGSDGYKNLFPGGGLSAGTNLSVTGTLSTYNQFNAARFGTSGYSDGNYQSLSYADLLSADSGVGSVDIAVSFWFKGPNVDGSNRYIIENRNAGDSQGWAVRLSAAANKVTFRVNSTNVSTSNTYTPGVWSHVYIYFKQNTAGTMYLNGVATDLGAISLSNSGGTPIYVGRDTSTGSAASSTTLSDLVIWTNPGVSLTQAEVSSVYSGGNPTTFGASTAFKDRWSILAQTGQKISAKATLDRVAGDTDTPILWSFGAVKT